MLPTWSTWQQEFGSLRATDTNLEFMRHIKEDYRDNCFNKGPIFIRVLDKTINQYAQSLFKHVEYMTNKIKHGKGNNNSYGS